MKDTYTNYPMSSCNCSTCPDMDVKPFSNPNLAFKDCENADRCIVPKNNAVKDCFPNPGYNCFDKGVYKLDKQPKFNLGSEFVNIGRLGMRNSVDFRRIECDDGICPKTTYVSNDPRLLDVPRNSVLKLDRPSI